MTLYVDTSALVKLYVSEADSVTEFSVMTGATRGMPRLDHD